MMCGMTDLYLCWAKTWQWEFLCIWSEASFVKSSPLWSCMSLGWDCVQYILRSVELFRLPSSLIHIPDKPLKPPNHTFAFSNTLLFSTCLFSSSLSSLPIFISNPCIFIEQSLPLSLSQVTPFFFSPPIEPLLSPSVTPSCKNTGLSEFITGRQKRDRLSDSSLVDRWPASVVKATDILHSVALLPPSMAVR